MLIQFLQEVLNTLEPLARASVEALFGSQPMEEALSYEEENAQHESKSFAVQAKKSETRESSESSSDGCGDTKYFDGLSGTAHQSPR